MAHTHWFRFFETLRYVKRGRLAESLGGLAVRYQAALRGGQDDSSEVGKSKRKAAVLAGQKNVAAFWRRPVQTVFAVKETWFDR